MLTTVNFHEAELLICQVEHKAPVGELRRPDHGPLIVLQNPHAENCITSDVKPPPMQSRPVKEDTPSKCQDFDDVVVAVAEVLQNR